MGPQPKHHIKNITQSCIQIILAHQFCTKTTWRASRVARRNMVPNRLAGISHHQAPSANRILSVSSPPGELHPTARRLVLTVATATVLRPYRLAARSTPPGVVTSCQDITNF